MTDQSYTRRDFLRDSACGAMGLALGVPAAVRALEEPTGRSSRVVLVRHPDAVDESGEPNADIVSNMLDEAVTALLGIESPASAWKALLRPEDVLGIKTNVWSPLRTPSVLEQAVKKRALGAGIPEDNLSIKDRGVLDDPVFRKSTALINARPLRIHHWSGIGGCIKNYIMFVREPWTWHDDSCADLGGLWKLDVCRGKTRLNVLVVLTPQFYGVGPHHFDPAYVWPYKGLLVGRDPVALDALGVRLLDEMRKRSFDPPPKGGTSTKHVRLAETRHGIGVADLERIELVRIGWTEESMI